MTRGQALIAGDLRAIIYLRLSDFRHDDPATFQARRAELEDLARRIGARVIRVATENDMTASGRVKYASAYKTPKRVETSTGLVTFRTRRPEFEAAVLDLQNQVANVLIVGDSTRITRNHRDGADLMDACASSGASAVALDDDGDPDWLLTAGGTRKERDAFMDRVEAARRYSADVSRGVAKGRRRWAGTSYHGGRRPFGFRVRKGTDAYARTLDHDPREAAEITNAAHDLLHGVSLNAVKAGLIWRGVPTVMGAPWSSRTVRDMLLKPAAAGLQLRGGELVAAPWEPILDRPTWERLRELLTDPERKTTTGNEPKYLVSGYATCGKPGCGRVLNVTGSGRRNKARTYVGKCNHIRRVTDLVDEAVGLAVVKVMERPEAARLLRPRPRAADVDRAALNTELDRLRGKAAVLARQFAADVLTEHAMEAGMEVIRGQERAITAQLAATDDVDPLPEFRGPRDAAEIWAGLPLARQRAVVQTLFASIVIMPAGKGNRAFNPELIKMTPRPEVMAVAA